MKKTRKQNKKGSDKQMKINGVEIEKISTKELIGNKTKNSFSILFGYFRSAPYIFG